VTTQAKSADPVYGSDVIVDLLRAAGIEYAAFNPGASFRGIHDSIVNYGGNRMPEAITCTHEEISVAMAHGYAKATGRPMVALLHNVVGLQHACMAIFNAWCDRVPVLLLGGTGPIDAAARRPWIEWIHTALVQGNQIRDYVKWDDQPHTLASVPESLLRAMRIATTDPAGPVYVCFDSELQERRADKVPPTPDWSRFRPPAPMQADEDSLREAARLLMSAERPVVIAERVGRCPASVGALVELAETVGAPVLDRNSRFNFPSTHPLDLSGANRETVQQADVVLALDVQDVLGTVSATDIATGNPSTAVFDRAKIITISVEHLLTKSWASDYQALAPVDVPITAETSVAIPRLSALCREAGGNQTGGNEALRTARKSEIAAKHAALRDKWQCQAEADSTRTPIAASYLAAEIWRLIRQEDWVLVNGDLNGWCRRIWDWERPNCYLGRSGGGGVGYGIGASVGAALAHRGSGKLCVDIQGDGDLLFTPGALWTLAHHRIPLLLVMWNNRSYYNSEAHAERIARARSRPVENIGVGTRIEDPEVDFASLARSFGLHGEGPISEPGAIRPALERALRAVKEEGRAALVDVRSDAQ
jgi:thiamine pyrophosphate-dependent acetolactate synthase large subunit-like protein